MSTELAINLSWFVSGILIATVFWGGRHSRLEKKLNDLIRKWESEDEADAAIRNAANEKR